MGPTLLYLIDKLCALNIWSKYFFYTKKNNRISRYIIERGKEKKASYIYQTKIHILEENMENFY